MTRDFYQYCRSPEIEYKGKKGKVYHGLFYFRDNPVKGHPYKPFEETKTVDEKPKRKIIPPKDE